MNNYEYLSDSVHATLAELSMKSDPLQLAETLASKLREPFSLHVLWQYRPFLHKLPDHILNQYPSLLTAASIIAAFEGDEAKSTAYFNNLPIRGYYRIYAKLASPFTTWPDYISAARLLVAEQAGPVPNLSITAGRPYIINGFRDFTVTLDKLSHTSDQSIHLFESLYGPRSRTALTVALAEAQYMRDERFEALASVVGTIPFLTQDADAQILFPALYLQMLIMVMTGQVPALEPMMKQLRNQLHHANRSEWLPNLDALDAHSALYSGDYAKVSEWMRNAAPDEHSDFSILDLYRYMVKLRVYIVQQKHFAFFTLSAKLLPLLQRCNRAMDECELRMLMAIDAHARSEKDLAFSHLSRALALAEQYRYDRLLADEGEPLLRLLLLYRKEQGSTPYLSHIISLARKTASFYPRYLKSQLPEAGALSETELIVLRFLAHGRSNSDIAELLDVQVNTVKAHCKHIAKKLQTKNRQQAVNRAIELGILDPILPSTPFTE